MCSEIAFFFLLCEGAAVRSRYKSEEGLRNEYNMRVESNGGLLEGWMRG